jgi:SOS-response transcriptional repressor LexA
VSAKDQRRVNPGDLELLELIRRHPGASVRELCAITGWSSSNAVHERVRRLRHNGWLMHKPYAVRTYTSRIRLESDRKALTIRPQPCAKCGAEHFCASQLCGACGGKAVVVLPKCTSPTGVEPT